MRKMTGDEFDERVSFFDDMARSSWLTPLHETLLSMTPSWNEKTVLDVGCGTGRFLLKGATPTTRIIGIDLSKEMIHKASHLFSMTRLPKSQYTFIMGDAEELPLQTETFDLVFSTCVIFLLPNPTLALKEIHRVLKKGGKIGLLNPTENLTMKKAEELIKRWNLKGIDESTIRQWGKVSERRHRFNENTLELLLHNQSLSSVFHQKELENTALITVATKN